MMRKLIGRRAGRSLALLVIASLAAAFGVLSVASTALATPKGEFAIFADCPVAVPGLNACLYANTTSGVFTVGNKTVPLEKPIVLQGGLKARTEDFELVAAKDGNTLAKVPQNVPGGLSGLVNCTAIKGSGFLEVLERESCKSIFENGLTGVTATTELAAPASSVSVNVGALLAAEGAALTLPIKVHLENPLLGSSCYIGSNSAPIVVPFTTGTTSPPLPNKPITGAVGSLEVAGEGAIIKITGNSLVNNSFAAPKTNGCGGIFEFLIRPIINASLGVPAASGHNTAILNGTLETGNAEAVIASE